MRFVSEYASFGMQIRPIRTMLLATGQEQVLQEPLYVTFTQGDVTEYEIAQAKERFAMRGYMTERDEVTMTTPILRLSTFDTDLKAIEEHWDEETKALVEQTLLAKQDAHLFYCPPTPVKVPWPNYDSYSREHSPEDVYAKLREDGHSTIDVIRYERSPDGQRREDLITYLEQKLEEEEAESSVDKEWVPA